MMNINDKTSPILSHTIGPDQTKQDQSNLTEEEEASYISDKKDLTCLKEKHKQDQEEEIRKDSGRDKLTKHRRDVAGRVWIPGIWGQEELLKDWIDCSTFDTCLVPDGISSARAALVDEARRADSASSGGLHNRCFILS
ncbi:unnamed protein product [Cochlearia groenlandica]